MNNVAFIQTDLSRLRLVGDGVDTAWTAPPIPEDESDSARPLLQRAHEAAAWLNAQPAVRRRLHAAVLDVDEALCAWVKAPSEARPVVSAALRSLMQEWGDERLADSVEPLIESEHDAGDRDRSPLLRLMRSVRAGRSGAGDEGAEPTLEPTNLGVSLPVVALPDALIRLWLDALDRRGIRISRVISLWHALAAAWDDAPGPDVTAIVLIDEGRLVWAWAQDRGLLAGGAVEADRPRTAPEEGGDEPPPETDPRSAACKRLALDWLTWSSQLARTPDRIVIVGPGCREWAKALGEHWAPIDAQCVEDGKPIGTTLARIAAAPADSGPTSSRRALQTLTHRPTRAVRARYRIAAAAMLFLLVAVSSIAFRLRQKAGEWQREAGMIRQESIKIVRDGFPSLATSRITDPDKLAQTELNRLVESDPIDLPPSPRQIPLELQRVVSILADPTFEGKVRLQAVQMDQPPGPNQLIYVAPDRQVAAEIRTRLRAPGAYIDWEARRSPSPGDPLRPNLQGDWALQ